MAEVIEQATHTMFESCLLCCICIVFLGFIASLVAYLFDWATQE